ncbi:NACHT domain-containing protein [Streptomyces sp. NRRL F-2580]|uniref:NACHT domain-containing protein n=1 Tax=Streptomyces sp. NRRL F-2580 TaxID=1463841 RepID=UPI00131ADA9F|nr:helix-turn-helix domain-containing protein [Streptomyces sp. NRRL F-2580]
MNKDEREIRGGAMAEGEALAPQQALARLGTLLRDARQARKWAVRELAARAEIAVGTISQAERGKTTPNFVTLDALLTALGVEGEERAELEGLRDRAEPRTRPVRARAESQNRLLNDYVAAAREVARHHPHPFFLPGAAPSLSDVHWGQQAVPVDPNSPDDGNPAASLFGAGPRPLPAAGALAEKRVCVVTAGPGGGKSSLLRVWLEQGLNRWADSQAEEMPVLVPAESLVKHTFSKALATAVNEHLRPHGLLDDFPAEFFTHPPRAGARWLVLVDGLDEVTSTTARHDVVGALAALTKSHNAHLFRFVIAARPLPTREFRALGPDVAWYRLLPFSPEDVEQVACRWFNALGLPEPARAAERFTQDPAFRRIADLARTPLMAAMLCQLHVDSPGRELPTSRGMIFQQFTERLHERQCAAASPDSRQRYAGLERHGPAVLGRAEHTLEKLPELIGLLAAERRRDETVSAVDLVESQPAAQRPATVPSGEWRTFLEASLLRSGLLTVRAGRIVFLHQTLLEYCAARHANPEARATELARLLVKGWSRHWVLPQLDVSGRTPGRRYWNPPGREEESYFGFLLDDGEHDATAVIKELEHLANRGGLDGCRFLADQHNLGTELPSSVTRAVTDTLLRLCRIGRFELWRAKVAGGRWIADDPAPEIERMFARILSSFVIDDRVRAASTLLLLRDRRGLDVLTELARSPYLSGVCGPPVAARLAKLGDRNGGEILAAQAQDTGLTAGKRLKSAGFLAELGDDRGVELLTRLAHDDDVAHRHRAEAALWLADLHDHLAEKPAPPNGEPPPAAPLDPVGHDMLIAFAHDRTWRGSSRLRAVELLAGVDDGRAREVYAQLSNDTTLRWWHRLRARRAVSGRTNDHGWFGLFG